MAREHLFEANVKNQRRLKGVRCIAWLGAAVISKEEELEIASADRIRRLAGPSESVRRADKSSIKLITNAYIIR